MKHLLETRCDRERVAIIFNPASGQEESHSRREAIEDLARSAGLACDLTETDVSTGAGPLARRAAEDGAERVLVSGGDGSVTEAAGALVGTPAALAVIPGGTGNLLAMNLGIPTDVGRAMELALTGEARPIDVGRANGHVFLIMAGIGMDARMIRDADRELKDRLGVLAYFVAAMRNMGRPRRLYVTTIDGRRFPRHAQSVMVTNLGRITGGVELVPGTDSEDGLLEVAILRIRGWRDLARVALRAILGISRSDGLLEIHRGREVVIETRQPQPVQLDGNEAATTTRLEVKVEPRALLLVQPTPAEEARESTESSMEHAIAV